MTQALKKYPGRDSPLYRLQVQYFNTAVESSCSSTPVKSDLNENSIGAPTTSHNALVLYPVGTTDEFISLPLCLYLLLYPTGSPYVDSY